LLAELALDAPSEPEVFSQHVLDRCKAAERDGGANSGVTRRGRNVAEPLPFRDIAVALAL